MSDMVMKEEDSNTLSVKELDAAVLPRDQPVNELTSPNYIDSDDTLNVKELGTFLQPPYKHTPPPSDDPFELERVYKDLFAAMDLDDELGPPGEVYEFNMFDFIPPNIRFSPPVDINCHQVPFMRPPPGGHLCLCLNYSQSEDAMHAQPVLCAKIGLHCYNLENGTHFERLGRPQVAEHTDLYTLEAWDPLLRNYTTCMFETKVRFATDENKDCFHVTTTRCKPFPLPPPGEEGIQCEFDTLSVDELFKGNMPDWLPDDSKLHYYEMKESEVEQAKDWLHLYAELAFYTKKHTDSILFEYLKPLELGKVVVQTRGVVENVNMLDNAVFFITFKTRRGHVCKGIIRRTRDGTPEHLSLEAKCFM